VDDAHAPSENFLFVVLGIARLLDIRLRVALEQFMAYIWPKIHF